MHPPLYLWQLAALEFVACIGGCKHCRLYANLGWTRAHTEAHLMKVMQPAFALLFTLLNAGCA